MYHSSRFVPVVGDVAETRLPAIDGQAFVVNLGGDNDLAVQTVDPLVARDYFRSLEVAARMAADAAQAKLDDDAIRGAA